LERFLPGEIVDGVILPETTSTRLKYTMNGHLAFWLSLLCMGHIIPIMSQTAKDVWVLKGLRPLPLDMIYTHYVELIAASIAFSAILSIYLYIISFLNFSPMKKILAKGGNTGSSIYDFFIGRELNPRIAIPFCSIDFDLKCFCELRPGLIGWAVIDLAMAFAQYKKLGYISGSMFLIVLFQGFYVWDALYMEKAILTTMDITTDGFGYMLAFGDLAWVPFIYSLQARYLVDYDPGFSITSLIFIAVIHFIGFFIFR
jgi:delta14-sterol reductase